MAITLGLAWRRSLPLAFLLSLVFSLVLPAAAPAGAQGATATQAEVGRVSFIVEPGLGVEASEMAEAYGPAITEAWPQFRALFDTEPATPQFVAFVNQLDPDHLAGMRWVTDTAWVSPDGSVAVIAFDSFVALSPIEAGNVLRNVVSRGFIQAAAGNAMPIGLVDGLARYLETPVMARQARLGSLVQGEHQAGILPDWNEIAAGTAPDRTHEQRTANAYALVAFLIERYGVDGMRELVAGFRARPQLAANLTATFQQDQAGLDAAWEQFLPRWFASGWRSNAVSAFDLSRAQELFDRGAYEAASAEAERSQQLFADIGDEASLSRVEVLLAQCAVGLQADGLMAEAQAALEAHDYPLVQSLVTDAEALYALLPEPHRPGTIIEQYQSMASSGLGAQEQLARARIQSGGWLNVSAARDDAVAAGDSFATLGDADRAAEARQVVSQIDQRIDRMRMALSALVVILAMWLGTWLWLRAPARLQWRRLTGMVHPRRAVAGR